jgi:NAD(P)H-dependent FMN reductase
MTAPGILCFAGSARKDSVNKLLVKVAMKGINDVGVKANFIDLADFDMPVYNEDFRRSNGFPDSVLRLKQLMHDHQGMLIAAPEYNSSITALLKNAFDWASVELPHEKPNSLTCFRGKVAGLVAASPGALGGLRGLFHVREILQNVGVLVLPDMFALSHAYGAFDEAGDLKDESNRSRAQNVGMQLAQLTIEVANKAALPA